MRLRLSGFEAHGTAKHVDRALDIPIPTEQHLSERQIGRRQTLIERDRAFSGIPGPVQRFVNRHNADVSAYSCVVERHARPRTGVVRIQRDRRVEMFRRPSRIFGRIARGEHPAVEIALEGFGHLRAFFAQRVGHVPRQTDLERVGNGSGDIVLNREYVDELAVVALVPQLRIRSRLDEARTDPHARAVAADATLENVADTESFRDFIERGLRIADGETRRSRRHAKIVDARQYVQHFFGQTVAEKRCLLTTAEADEGQHRN